MFVGAAVLAWRGHPTLARGLGGLAIVVLALTLARPSALRDANHALGRAVTAALLSAVYLLALLPTRALLLALRVDPLAPRGPSGETHWLTRPKPGFAPEDMERTA